MTGVRRWLGALGLGIGMVGRTQRSVAQQDSTARDTTLEQRVDRLDQQIRILQRLRELAQDSAAAAAKDKPGVSAGKDGFSVESADGRFQLRLRGYVQADGRFFLQDSAAPATSTLLVRRARPILEATVWKYFDLRLMPDFGGGTAGLQDGYIDARLNPAFVLRAGKFKPPLGLERLQSATDLVFVERGLPTNLVPNRDVGFQAWGDVDSGLVSYAAGVFDGVPDLVNGDADGSDAKDLVGRIFLTPFRKSRSPLAGLSIGVAGSTGNERGSALAPALPSYRTAGQATVFRFRADPIAGTAIADGTRSRVVPQATFYTGALGIQAEYARSSQEVALGSDRATLHHQAWQVAASWFVTGEKAGYRTSAPKHPFDPANHGAGAFEIAARYGELTPDEDAFPIYASASSSVHKAREWAIGANWHFARSVRLMVDYEHTSFDGGAAGGRDRETENAVLTRIQHAF
jgi:phosphate-selective porin OprO/OprP